MYRFIHINLETKENTLPKNKKIQKTTPISLLSGGESFFVKVKSNQIATNYNGRGNKIKQNIPDKITKTYIVKEDKSETFSKYLSNSQNKKSFNFTVNISIDNKKVKNNNNIISKKSVNNKTRQDIYTHSKEIYSFPSFKYNEKLNNKSINSYSLRQNYNAVLLTDVELLKKNINKNNFNTNVNVKKVLKKKIEKNNKYSNNTFNNRINRNNTLNIKNKLNINKTVVETINQKNTKSKEKINNDLNAFHKSKNINKMKLLKKNQYNTKDVTNNNKTRKIYKNTSTILINNNSNVDELNNKKNISVGKTRIILQAQKINNKIIDQNEQKRTNNNSNILKDGLKENEKYISIISKRRNQKKIQSINIKQNKDSIKIQNNINNNHNLKNAINNRPSLTQKNNTNNNRHIISKSNNINKSSISNELNYTLNHLYATNPKSNNNKGNTNKKALLNENIDLAKKTIDDNRQKDYKNRNKYILSGLTPLYLDNKNKINNNNYPNIIINNNYLYNYIPFVTFTENEEKINRLNLNRNSFIESNLYSHNFNMNNSQNFLAERLFNLSNIIEPKISKKSKSKITKKYNEQKQQLKLNIIDNDNNKFNNIDANKYNFSKLICSNALGKNSYNNNIIKSKTNRNNLNSYLYQQNSKNKMTESYVSKKKIKKQKQNQNPPLNKIPKKLNILSLIQENSKKIKDSNYRSQPQFIPTLIYNDNNFYANRNKSYTIDDVLNLNNNEINDSLCVFDNFEDMNSIIKKINFDNVNIKSNNIFAVDNNQWHEKYRENFDNIFEKKFTNNKQNMSETQNKMKINNYINHPRQSGSTKENSSNKKIRISSYIDKKIERKK